MIVYEFKVKAKQRQYQAIDEAIRTAQFVRNKCLRYWMDGQNVNRAELYRYNTKLRSEFAFVKDLNSHATQASVERCWSSIARFFDNCKKRVRNSESHSECSGATPVLRKHLGNAHQEKTQQRVQAAEVSSADTTSSRQQVPGKKGYPRFKKNARSVEYKTSGWKLLDPKHIEFTDKKGIGKLKLVGTWDLAFYPEDKIKRVRLVRRADGYYCQFCISVNVVENLSPTHQTIGLDVGLKEFYTDSMGQTEPNPRFYRQGEERLKFYQRRVSRKVKGSANRKKAINKLGRQHLKISRKREEHAKRLARCVIQSNDLVAYEDLRIKNLVKKRCDPAPSHGARERAPRHHCLAKSINDAGWYQFRKWLEYFGTKMGRVTIAVTPAYTSQNCSDCGAVVKKSLSTRTHQ